MTRPGAEPKLEPGLDSSLAVDTPIRSSDAFDSDTFKLITKKRFGFVVPSLLLFSGVFLVLWIMQSSFPTVARYRLYGWVNFSFVYPMVFFPFVWILVYLFVRYTRREVYPLEELLNREFRKGPKHE